MKEERASLWCYIEQGSGYVSIDWIEMGNPNLANKSDALGREVQYFQGD